MLFIPDPSSSGSAVSAGKTTRSIPSSPVDNTMCSNSISVSGVIIGTGSSAGSDEVTLASAVISPVIVVADGFGDDGAAEVTGAAGEVTVGAAAADVWSDTALFTTPCGNTTTGVPAVFGSAGLLLLELLAAVLLPALPTVLLLPELLAEALPDPFCEEPCEEDAEGLSCVDGAVSCFGLSFANVTSRILPPPFRSSDLTVYFIDLLSVTFSAILFR